MNIQQFAIGVEFEYSLVAITVRDEEDARRRDGHISRLAEMFVIRSGDKGLSQRQAWDVTTFGELKIIANI